MENSHFIPHVQTTMSSKEAIELNPLVLAFVGDAVHTMYIRTKLVFTNKAKANALQKIVSKEVNATSQSHFIDSIFNILTEEEIAIFKRARNSKVHTSAKNSTIIDYKKASGFEAILGFLYLTGKNDRLDYILELTNTKED